MLQHGRQVVVGASGAAGHRTAMPGTNRDQARRYAQPARGRGPRYTAPLEALQRGGGAGGPPPPGFPQLRRGRAGLVRPVAVPPPPPPPPRPPPPPPLE